MPVFELSAVTEHLELLCERGVEARLTRLGSGGTINTSSVSPLDIVPQQNLVNIFLFHFHAEGPANRIESPEIDPARPLFFSKPLTLYYHVTAHHNVQGTHPHLVEQDLLGHVMSVLVDYSELTDTLEVGGSPLFEEALADADNVLEIEILKKTDSEALNVWAGHEGGAIRPSVYFKVKNVRLQPEAPPSFSVPILSIGNLTLPSIGPRIMRLNSSLTANFPATGGPVSRQFTREPAELYIGAGADDRGLVIEGSFIDPSVAVELTIPTLAGSETFRVDFIENGPLGWVLGIDNRRVILSTGTTIRRDVGGAMTPIALEPGAARLRVFRNELLSRDDEQVPTEIGSNPVSFTLHPHIGDIVLVAGRRYSIELDGDYDLDAILPGTNHAALVRLTIGGALYTVRDSAAGLSPGECAVSGPHALEYVLHDNVDAATVAQVQLWIRDCVSQPRWAGTT